MLTLLTLITALIDNEHRLVFEYMREENLVLRECACKAAGTNRLPLTDRQRKRLVVKDRPLKRSLLKHATDLFSPETYRRWYNKLVAEKYDGSANRKGGRPKITQEKINWVLKMAKENPGWGAGRISNYMNYLKMKISKASVWRIMVDHGFNPNPEIRRTGDWTRFIKSHFNILAATDFFSVELVTSRGLVRCMVLFIIDISTRRVHLAGIKPTPNKQWMQQIARNLTDYEDGFLNGK